MKYYTRLTALNDDFQRLFSLSLVEKKQLSPRVHNDGVGRGTRDGRLLWSTAVVNQSVKL